MLTKTAAINTAREAPLPPELDALMGLYHLHGRLTCRVEAMSLSKPVTKQERHLIIRLSKPRRIGDVACEMAALPSSMTALADSLCGKSLLTRMRDPDDKRAHLIMLTPEGEAIRKTLLDDAQSALVAEAGLSAAEAAQFADLLRKVRSHLSGSDEVPCGTHCT